MEKRIVRDQRLPQAADLPWLDLEHLTRVELTSEDAAHPVESALFPSGDPGWRAGEPGEQTIRLVFSQPLRIHHIHLRFIERDLERTQEFALRWSRGGSASFQELVRQQYTFSPSGATSEVEDLRVDLSDVAALELTIIPDQGRDEACATLAEWRLA